VILLTPEVFTASLTGICTWQSITDGVVRAQSGSRTSCNRAPKSPPYACRKS